MLVFIKLLFPRTVVLMFLTLVIGLLFIGPVQASEQFLADVNNSRRIDMYPDKIAIYLAKPDLANNRVVALYPYVQSHSARGNDYKLKGDTHTRFRLKDTKQGQRMVISGQSFPVNVVGLPRPVIIDRIWR